MFFSTMTAITTVLGLTAAVPTPELARAPAGHVNTAPYGGKDTYFEGYPPKFDTKTTIVAPHATAPANYINTAPYGDKTTFFEGLPEAQHMNRTLRARDLSARDVAGVYWCGKDEWRGDCHYQIASGGACHNYPPANKGFNGAFSSFGPDHGIYCIGFSDNDCTHDQPGWGWRTGRIEWPGIKSFADNNPVMNGLIVPASYRCHWK